MFCFGTEIDTENRGFSLVLVPNTEILVPWQHHFLDHLIGLKSVSCSASHKYVGFIFTIQKHKNVNAHTTVKKCVVNTIFFKEIITFIQ